MRWALAVLQFAHQRVGQADTAGDWFMRPPLILGIGDTDLNQDGEFVEPLVDAGPEAQVVEQVEAAARHLRAAQQGVVRPTQRGTGHRQDVISQRPDFRRKFYVAELGEAFGHAEILGRAAPTNRVNPRGQ